MKPPCSKWRTIAAQQSDTEAMRELIEGYRHATSSHRGESRRLDEADEPIAAEGAAVGTHIRCKLTRVL